MFSQSYDNKGFQVQFNLQYSFKFNSIHTSRTSFEVLPSWSPSSRSGAALAAGGFGQSKGPVHLDQVRCTGKEEFLGECPSLGLSIQGCKRRHDAGVRCDVTPPPPRGSATRAEPRERSCGLRKLVEGDGKRRRSQGEESLLR